MLVRIRRRDRACTKSSCRCGRRRAQACSGALVALFVMSAVRCQMMQLQENLFNIKMYHTPSGLRALTRIFILFTPWLFG